MAMRLLPISLSFCLGLQACLPEAEPAGAVRDVREEKRCEEQGGRYLLEHPHVSYECVLPFADAGKSCTRASDCRGQCMAETKTCSARNQLFGTWQELDDQGNVITVEGY